MDSGAIRLSSGDMFVLSRQTLLNPAVLETQSLPKRIFGRVMVWPRREADLALWARLIFEVQILRFCLPLIPFIAAMLIWPGLALPIAQAPVPMLILIGFVEMKVLRQSEASRMAQITEDEYARALDLLRFRGQDLLRAWVVKRDLRAGTVRLVIEQSEMARIAPLTLVSIQFDQPKPHVVELTAEERQALQDELFADGLSERDLQRANQRDQQFLREITFEAKSASAYSRLKAVM